MKQVMTDQKHLWVVLGDESTNFDEVIIDREREDVRVRIGNRVIKIQYRTKENERSEIRGVLMNDIYIIPVPTKQPSGGK